jgi:hypothetical protein
MLSVAEMTSLIEDMDFRFSLMRPNHLEQIEGTFRRDGRVVAAEHDLRFVEEPDPRGTAGALKYAEDLLEERFLMLNGDVLSDMDLSAQIAAHERSGARATLALVAVEDKIKASGLELSLIELVKIDLERQWQQGRRPLLEEYLQRYPELEPEFEFYASSPHFATDYTFHQLGISAQATTEADCELPQSPGHRDGAPVAAPLKWDEVESSKLKPDQFNIHNIFERLKKVGNPWKDLSRHARKLPG